MKFKSFFSISANVINIIIFFYFVASLAKVGLLDMSGLLISGFAILIALISNIVDNLP